MMTRPLPIRVGEDVKIVWRMTGEGPIELSAIGSDGTRTAPTWGPTAHGNGDVSNFDAPGDEWGAGYRFGSPGCWRLRARRTVGQAEALVFVAPD